jgi:nifR3 family TIM-barrel protein
MAVQLFGRDPHFLSEAAKMIEDGSYAGCKSQAAPAAIDLNMGCPVPKIVGNGEGSALLKNPVLAGELVRAVKAAVKIPVTVKIRIGFDSEHINAVEMAKILEDSGADAICVHGRTREQMYRPGVSLEQIAAVKAAVKIPVIGNGDIYTAADALHMREVTGCDGWMIARGAMGNPWLFAEITAALDGTVYTPPTLCERLSLAREHMHAMMAEKGEKVGFSESKKQMAWYIHGVPGAATARGKLMLCTTAEEAEEAGRAAARYLENGPRAVTATLTLTAGQGVGYVVPQRVTLPADSVRVYFRVSAPLSEPRFTVRCGDRVLLSRKKLAAMPGEMESLTLTAEMLKDAEGEITVSAEEIRK